MTDRADGQWRWPLPDDWEPVGTWCVQITIPADQQYFDRLTGALGMLTLSKAWFPDPTGQGPRTVAATWEAALYMNPFNLNENCIVVPTPVITSPEQAADQAAALFILFYQYIVGQLNTCATSEPLCDGCVDTIMGELASYGATEAVRGALGRLCRDLNADPTGRADFETDCPYTDQFADLKTKIADNPYDWLNHLSDWIFDWLNTTASDIFNDLNTVAGLLGGGALNKWVDDHGGPGGGATFGGGCTWTHTFDLTSVDGGFVAGVVAGNTRSEWIDGVGWSSMWGLYPSSISGRVNDIGRAVAGSAIVTDIVVSYDAAPGSFSGGAPPAVSELYVNFSLETSQELTAGSGQTIEYHNATGVTFSQINLFMRVGFLQPSTDDPGGSGVYTSITMSGTGLDPFA